MRKGISVIICTYNGAERLPKTIGHIARQTASAKINWEVILADNGSTDGSKNLAYNIWNEQNLAKVSFRVIFECRPGKLYALQNAIDKAEYEYLIICDDDNWLSPDYVENAYQLLESMPEIGAIGGQGIPVTDGIKLPEWFKDHHSDYAVGQQAKTTGFLKPRAVLWGAGLCTRKTVYKEMYKTFPSLLTEHPTANILSAEDTEYCMRLNLKGYRLYYDANLKYQHFIPAHKLTKEFRDQKLLKGFDNANDILRNYHAAMRATVKTKGRPDLWLYLVIISFLQLRFHSSATKAEKARTTLFFLLGRGIKANGIAGKIKEFLNK